MGWGRTRGVYGLPSQELAHPARGWPSKQVVGLRLHSPLPSSLLLLQDGHCDLGEACPFAHNVFEYVGASSALKGLGGAEASAIP